MRGSSYFRKGASAPVRHALWLLLKLLLLSLLLQLPLLAHFAAGAWWSTIASASCIGDHIQGDGSIPAKIFPIEMGGVLMSNRVPTVMLLGVLRRLNNARSAPTLRVVCLSFLATREKALMKPSRSHKRYRQRRRLRTEKKPSLCSTICIIGMSRMLVSPLARSMNVVKMERPSRKQGLMVSWQKPMSTERTVSKELRRSRFTSRSKPGLRRGVAGGGVCRAGTQKSRSEPS